MGEVDGIAVPTLSQKDAVRADGLVLEPSREALAIMANNAARSVKGVHDLAARAQRRGREDPTAGVHVQLFDHRVVFDVRVVAGDDVPLLDIASAVRREVITEVESQTDLRVIEVNVAIDDLVEVLAG